MNSLVPVPDAICEGECHHNWCLEAKRPKMSLATALAEIRWMYVESPNPTESQKRAVKVVSDFIKDTCSFDELDEMR